MDLIDDGPPTPGPGTVVGLYLGSHDMVVALYQDDEEDLTIDRKKNVNGGGKGLRSPYEVLRCMPMPTPPVGGPPRNEPMLSLRPISDL